ncbi:hypothetical protein H0H92_004012 [Tricholoma furcatifolium]|nr:hypothetical protein H0H92_004012 [Tricholoma furcatifolium]
MGLAPQTLSALLKHIADSGVTPGELAVELLHSNIVTYEYIFTNLSSPAVHELLNTLQNNSNTKSTLLSYAHTIMKETYASEIQSLSKREAGFHFDTLKTTEKKLREFDMEGTARKISEGASLVWDLLDRLFLADLHLSTRRDRRKSQRELKKTGDDTQRVQEQPENSDDEYWTFYDESVPLVDEGDDEPEDLVDLAKERQKRLITVKKLVCISIMLQNTNQNCNALQTIIGVFLQSCNAPETVREFLAHAGLSVSTTSINNAIRSLSKESEKRTQRLGQTLTALLAYDNLDFDAKQSVPTLEKPQDTMFHLTSGTMLPLYEISADDLNCSDALWAHSPINPEILPSDMRRAAVSFEDLVALHPETEHPSGLLRSERFNAWMYRHDLVHYGPELFRKFRNKLGDPEVIDAIPLKKTSQIPNRALPLAPNTASNNADAIDSFFRQARVGDPIDDPSVQRDIDNHVVLVCGDLLTGERIRSLVQSRSEEKTPWRRFQYVIYVMGLFHLKMACADAIWRIFIHPRKARLDENSLINHVGQIRPKETAKIESNPGFRRMHEVIQHVGIVSRLRDWANKAGCATLEEFAESDPSWEKIEAMSNELALEKVARADTVSDLRENPPSIRDEQMENLLLRQQYFLLYEEMSHALNAGDIGRVETLFLPWIFIFTGCGKHKYAAEMKRYLENVHFHYPEGLNPARIIDESSLIEVYKNTRLQLETMFCLEHKTTRHSPPKMKITFSKLDAYIKKHNGDQTIAGRKSQFRIPDAMSEGLHIITTPKGSTTAASDTATVVDNEVYLELEDVEIEVEDDGSLDV